jgi:PleD family two-component response regulator
MKNEHRSQRERDRDLSILIVDDDEEILHLVTRILKKSNPNYYIETASCVKKAIELASASYWDTILLDISLPMEIGSEPSPVNGLYTLDYLNTELKISVPVIAMTGHDDSDLLEQVLDRGAYYFLNKPLQAKPLAAIVKNATRFQLSGFDGLTGLLNRFTFEERLKTEFEKVKRTNGLNTDEISLKLDSTERPFISLLFLDVDNFKTINDTYSHMTGDQVLKIISAVFKDESIYRKEPSTNDPSAIDRIKMLIRPYDIASRFGGDEFAIFLPETDQNGALSVASRIKEILMSVKISQISGAENINSADDSTISISMGLATYPYPDIVDTYSDMIKLADQAMYMSKENRKGEIFAHTTSGRIEKIG